jgi:hypothetical protein
MMLLIYVGVSFLSNVLILEISIRNLNVYFILNRKKIPVFTYIKKKP